MPKKTYFTICPPTWNYHFWEVIFTNNIEEGKATEKEFEAPLEKWEAAQLVGCGN